MPGHENNIVFLPVGDAARGAVAALWQTLSEEAGAATERDRALVRVMNSAVLMHADFGHALSHRPAIELANHDVDRDERLALIYGAYTDKPGLLGAAAAVKDRHPGNSAVDAGEALHGIFACGTVVHVMALALAGGLSFAAGRRALADKAADIVVGGPVHQLRGRSHLNDAAGPHEHDTVGDAKGLVDVMGHEHRCLA